MTVIEIQDGYIVSLDGVYTVNLNQGSSVEITDGYTIQINNAKGDEGEQGPQGIQGIQGATGPKGNDGIDGIGRKIGNYIVGRYYPIVGSGIPTTFTTLAVASNRIDLSPVTITETITPSEIGVLVTTGGVPGVVFKICIYSSGANGFPENLFWNSADLVGTGTNVYRFSTTSLPTLTRGVTYWVGTFAVAALTVRAIPATGLFQIGGIGTTPSTANFGTIIRRTMGDPFYTLPNPFGFVATQITNNIAAPLILIKP
jgi:hypothetical protein